MYPIRVNMPWNFHSDECTRQFKLQYPYWTALSAAEINTLFEPFRKLYNKMNGIISFGQEVCPLESLRQHARLK